MGFKTLHLIIGRKIRIFVIKRGDEADCDLIIFLVIDKPSANCIFEGPTLGMDNGSFSVLFWINFPKFLNANTIGLRLSPISKSKLID